MVARGANFPHMAASDAGRVAWGATLDYRWIMAGRQLSLKLAFIFGLVVWGFMFAAAHQTGDPTVLFVRFQH
jgi:hypothetical protein